MFPDAHAAFIGHLPPEERHDVLGAYLRRLVHPDPAIHIAAARAWSVYEGSCSTLLPSPDTVASFAQDRTALGLARIEAHFFAHDLFLRPAGLLAGMDRIAHLPADIIQGRYDTRCPPRQMEVYEAKMKGLGKDIEVVWFDSGHGTGATEELITWYDRMLRFARRVTGQTT